MGSQKIKGIQIVARKKRAPSKFNKCVASELRGKQKGKSAATRKKNFKAAVKKCKGK